MVRSDGRFVRARCRALSPEFGSIMQDRQRQFAKQMRSDPTDAERVLWPRLKHDIELSGSHFRRQALIGPFIVDFVSRKARLVIELDGGQHDENRAAGFSCVVPCTRSLATVCNQRATSALAVTTSSCKPL